MNEIIQNNIKESDLAYDVKLRIDFIEQVSESELDSIDSLLSSVLIELGIGFGSAQGSDFISAVLLNFGETPKFSNLRNCVNDTLTHYKSIIKQIYYNKSEFTQASFNFITEKKSELETVLTKSKIVFPQIVFSQIINCSDSPESRHFSGSDPEETIAIFISEINYAQKDWITFSIGCKRLNEEEIDALLDNINQIHANSSRIKWYGFDYNYEMEVWELPKRQKLFDFYNDIIN